MQLYYLKCIIEYLQFILDLKNSRYFCTIKIKIYIINENNKLVLIAWNLQNIFVTENPREASFLRATNFRSVQDVQDFTLDWLCIL